MNWLLLPLVALVAFWLLRRTRHAGVDLRVGDAAPDFSLPDQHGECHTLKEYAGNWLVLYFYPRDDTPGCTEEACNFRDDLHQFGSLGAHVVGISVDDTKRHAAFAAKYALPFTLLADSTGGAAARYGVLFELPGFRIAKRRTFLIDPHGRIAKAYGKVATSRHAREIIDDLKKFTRAAA